MFFGVLNLLIKILINRNRRRLGSVRFITVMLHNLNFIAAFQVNVTIAPSKAEFAWDLNVNEFSVVNQISTHNVIHYNPVFHLKLLIIGKDPLDILSPTKLIGLPPSGASFPTRSGAHFPVLLNISSSTSSFP